MKATSKHLICILFIGVFAFSTRGTQAAPPHYYYVLKVFHFKSGIQQQQLEQYIRTALMPGLKRISGEPVGVFKTLEQDTVDKRIYVMASLNNWDKVETLDSKIQNDQQYITDSKSYADAPYNQPPYDREETIILRAFPKWPAPTTPKLNAPKSERIYELRSYESPTDRYHLNKIKMFNDGGETVLFNRLNFNAVFYAQVIAGSHMPNLMYMTTFNNKQDRDKHWDTFSNDPEWKRLSSMDQYQHNVSKADIIFLHPAEYSDY